MQIFFLAFGQKPSIYYQACFCILSLLKEAPQANISVATDHPDFFNYFGSRLQIVLLSRPKLEDWKGRTGFFWRIKIKAIEDAILRYPGEHIIFLDTDTFLTGGIEPIRSLMDEGVPLMHECEGKLCEIGGKTERSMWKAFNKLTFSSIKIDTNTVMWNSGVVAIPGHKADQAIELTLTLCDAMCTANVRLGVLEQFVFSLALKHVFGSIVPANRWIGHYWGNKDQWNEIIRSFLLQSFLEKRSLEQDLAKLKSFDYTALPIRKRRQKKWVKNLEKMLDKHFPLKPHLFHPSSETT